MYVIYALVDPRDNTVRYVGITTDVYERFMQHINCNSANFTKNAWIMELRAANKMVIMETLEEAESREEALDRESYWIKHFEMLKEPLVNISQRSSARKAKKNNLRIGRVIGNTFQTQEALVIPSTVGNLATVNVKHKVDVPPEIRNEIIRLRKRGFNRTEIRDAMGFSGEQFKMIKQVLDEEGL